MAESLAAVLHTLGARAEDGDAWVLPLGALRIGSVFGGDLDGSATVRIGPHSTLTFLWPAELAAVSPVIIYDASTAGVRNAIIIAHGRVRERLDEDITTLRRLGFRARAAAPEPRARATGILDGRPLTVSIDGDGGLLIEEVDGREVPPEHQLALEKAGTASVDLGHAAIAETVRAFVRTSGILLSDEQVDGLRRALRSSSAEAQAEVDDAVDDEAVDEVEENGGLDGVDAEPTAVGVDPPLPPEHGPPPISADLEPGPNDARNFEGGTDQVLAPVLPAGDATLSGAMPALRPPGDATREVLSMPRTQPETASPVATRVQGFPLPALALPSNQSQRALADERAALPNVAMRSLQVDASLLDPLPVSEFSATTASAPHTAPVQAAPARQVLQKGGETLDSTAPGDDDDPLALEVRAQALEDAARRLRNRAHQLRNKQLPATPRNKQLPPTPQLHTDRMPAGSPQTSGLPSLMSMDFEELLPPPRTTPSAPAPRVGTAPRPALPRTASPIPSPAGADDDGVPLAVLRGLLSPEASPTTQPPVRPSDDDDDVFGSSLSCDESADGSFLPAIALVVEDQRARQRLQQLLVSRVRDLRTARDAAEVVSLVDLSHLDALVFVRPQPSEANLRGIAALTRMARRPRVLVLSGDPRFHEALGVDRCVALPQKASDVTRQILEGLRSLLTQPF